jgi:RNA-directed DNA polymerase
MNSSLFKKNQLKHLSSIIGCRPKEIEFIASNINDYYSEWFEKKKDNATGDFKRFKDGTIKKRTIRPSLNRLKVIQSSIKKKILVPIALPDNVHGGVVGRSNITNAKPHQGKKFKFTTDLKDFYPSVRSDMVYHAFLVCGVTNHFAHWLTKLTTWKHELPQGTPTSTHISNIAFLETDRKLILLCKEHKLTYTRYIDDLTFSSDKDFKSFLPEIIQIVQGDGFKINYRKTNYSNGVSTITGIDVFNNFIDAPTKIKIKAAQEKLTNSESKPYSIYKDRIRKTNRRVMKQR